MLEEEFRKSLMEFMSWRGREVSLGILKDLEFIEKCIKKAKIV